MALATSRGIDQADLTIHADRGPSSITVPPVKESDDDDPRRVKTNVTATAEDAAKLFKAAGADASKIAVGLSKQFGRTAEDAAKLAASTANEAAKSTPAQLLDLIELKGQEVAAALAALRALG